MHELEGFRGGDSDLKDLVLNAVSKEAAKQSQDFGVIDD